MKKIIDGKMYNTETATMVGDWWNGYSVRDFNHCFEELYRKKTGEYFLYGCGGPLSRYAVSSGSGWSGGENIVPFTKAQAMRWAEKHLDADEYVEEFGEVEE